MSLLQSLISKVKSKPHPRPQPDLGKLNKAVAELSAQAGVPVEKFDSTAKARFRIGTLVKELTGSYNPERVNRIIEECAKPDTAPASTPVPKPAPVQSRTVLDVAPPKPVLRTVPAKAAPVAKPAPKVELTGFARVEAAIAKEIAKSYPTTNGFAHLKGQERTEAIIAEQIARYAPESVTESTVKGLVSDDVCVVSLADACFGRGWMEARSRDCTDLEAACLNRLHLEGLTPEIPGVNMTALNQRFGQAKEPFGLRRIEVAEMARKLRAELNAQRAMRAA